MRRIIINEVIIDLSKDYVDNLFRDRKDDFKFPLDNLSNLEAHLRKQEQKKFADYIHKIIDNYNIVNCIKPQYFESLYQRYFNTLTNADLSTKIKYREKNKEFYKHIVEAMRYDAVRDKEFLPYVRLLGIKTCVYCNTQLAITTENKKGTLSGKYDLDHFLPQSRYPFLCTSFFNLQPSCPHCNKSKSKNESLFGLYTHNYKELSPFFFKIDQKSVVKYMLSQNCEDLEIIFDSTDALLRINHEKNFHITELYSTQKDIVEEIIWKAKIYNESYKKNLLTSFSKLFSKTTDFNRFILGNYDQAHLCHKRPLAKLMHDVAKQFGLI